MGQAARMKLRLTFALLVALVFTTVCQADQSSKKHVYKFVDSNGQVSYSDKSLHDGYVKLVKTWKG